MSEKPTVGLSACLAGEHVRFDAGHRKDGQLLQELDKCFTLTSFCPEVSAGLGLPRRTIRLYQSTDEILAVSGRDNESDVTGVIRQEVERQSRWVSSLSGFVVKKSSPSCGMERVKVYDDKSVRRDGVGIFTKALMEKFPQLPIEEEGRLKNPQFYDSFILRVFAYQRWQALMDKGADAAVLRRFHASYKFNLMARDMASYNKLGRLVASMTRHNRDRMCDAYFKQFMEALKIPASRKGNYQVLQRLAGFLKKQLPQEDKRYLGATMDRYRKGEVPFIAPKVLFDLYFQRYANHYVEQSHFLSPYPVEIGLYKKL